MLRFEDLTGLAPDTTWRANHHGFTRTGVTIMETDSERYERERKEANERHERERKEAHERHERERREERERHDRDEEDEGADS